MHRKIIDLTEQFCNRIVNHWGFQAVWIVLQIMLVLYSLKTAYLHQNWHFFLPLTTTLFVLLFEVLQKESFIFINLIASTFAKSRGIFFIPGAVEYIQQHIQIIYYHSIIVYRMSARAYFVLLVIYAILFCPISYDPEIIHAFYSKYKTHLKVVGIVAVIVFTPIIFTRAFKFGTEWCSSVNVMKDHSSRLYTISRKFTFKLYEKGHPIFLNIKQRIDDTNLFTAGNLTIVVLVWVVLF